MGSSAHLRTVVRAHGMSIVGHTVSEGLIPNWLSLQLIGLCITFGALREMSVLLEALSTHQLRNPEGPEFTEGEMRRVRGHLILVPDSFRFRFMARLMSRGQVPRSWLKKG